jgi:hypothetical protein
VASVSRVSQVIHLIVYKAKEATTVKTGRKEMTDFPVVEETKATTEPPACPAKKVRLV